MYIGIVNLCRFTLIVVSQKSVTKENRESALEGSPTWGRYTSGSYCSLARNGLSVRDRPLPHARVAY